MELLILVQVNENFAINLVAEEPVSNVESRVVSCDGGRGALGHPKVYINLVNMYFIKVSESGRGNEKVTF